EEVERKKREEVERLKASMIDKDCKICMNQIEDPVICLLCDEEIACKKCMDDRLARHANCVKCRRVFFNYFEPYSTTGRSSSDPSRARFRVVRDDHDEPAPVRVNLERTYSPEMKGRCYCVFTNAAGSVVRCIGETSSRCETRVAGCGHLLCYLCMVYYTREYERTGRRVCPACGKPTEGVILWGKKCDRMEQWEGARYNG
ncbi:hypothetical protein PMAYCL1PPCAC_27064, partial [Pristionchus mayeri]